jgi:hypothetical protein
VELGARFTILVELLRGTPRKGVSYLLVELGRNYPPLTIGYTHTRLTVPVHFVPLRLPHSPNGKKTHAHFFPSRRGHAAHLRPPVFLSVGLLMAKYGRSGPPRPLPQPSSSISMGKSVFCINFGLQPLELLLLASWSASSHLQPASQTHGQ